MTLEQAATDILKALLINSKYSPQVLKEDMTENPEGDFIMLRTGLEPFDKQRHKNVQGTRYNLNPQVDMYVRDATNYAKGIFDMCADHRSSSQCWGKEVGFDVDSEERL